VSHILRAPDVDVNAESSDGYTALDLVEDLALEEMLLKAGAKSSLELYPDAHKEL